MLRNSTSIVPSRLFSPSQSLNCLVAARGSATYSQWDRGFPLRPKISPVEGRKTADEADQALREIEQVSSRLAELIGSISGATQQQAVSAAQVAGKMKIILGITQLTTEGTKKTAASAARLTALADGLKNSVAGFKLA